MNLFYAWWVEWNWLLKRCWKSLRLYCWLIKWIFVSQCFYSIPLTVYAVWVNYSIVTKAAQVATFNRIAVFLLFVGCLSIALYSLLSSCSDFDDNVVGCWVLPSQIGCFFNFVDVLCFRVFCCVFLQTVVSSLNVHIVNVVPRRCRFFDVVFKLNFFKLENQHETCFFKLFRWKHFHCFVVKKFCCFCNSTVKRSGFAGSLSFYHPSPWLLTAKQVSAWFDLALLSGDVCCLCWWSLLSMVFSRCPCFYVKHSSLVSGLSERLRGVRVFS